MTKIPYRAWLAFLILLLLPQPGVIIIGGVAAPTGMRSLLLATTQQTLQATGAGNFWLSPADTINPSTTRADHQVEITEDGKLTNLNVELSGDIGGNTDDFDMEVFIGADACSVTSEHLGCTITGSGGVQDTCDAGVDTHECIVSAGDLVSFDWNIFVMPASVRVYVSMEFIADSGNASMLFSGNDATGNTTRYIPIWGVGSQTGGAGDRDIIAAVEGDISDFQCRLASAVVSAETWTFEILEDTGSGYTSLTPDAITSTCTSTEGAECTTDGDTAAFVEGDLYVIRSTTVSSPGARRTSCSMTITSDNGDFMIVSTSDNASSNADTEHQKPGGHNWSWATGRATRESSISQAITGTDLYCHVDTAPGAAASLNEYEFMVLEDANTTTLTCTIFEVQKECDLNSLTAALPIDSNLVFRSTPASTPNTHTGWSCAIAATLP